MAYLQTRRPRSHLLLARNKLEYWNSIRRQP